MGFFEIVYEEHKITRKVDKLIITVKENSKGSKNFLRSEQTFIDYMRENFVNQDILVFNDSLTGQKRIISISPAGKLYDKITSDDFNTKEAQPLWRYLYSLALRGELDILNSKHKKEGH